MLVRNGKSHYVTEFTTYKLHRLIVRSMASSVCTFFPIPTPFLFSPLTFASFDELMFDLFISSWQSDFYFILSVVVSGSHFALMFDVQK